MTAGCTLNPAPTPPAPAQAASAPAAAATTPAPTNTEATVLAHLEFLAGDALNGRGSGTRDEWLAAAYVASHMRRWGFEPLGDAGGYVQTIEMEHYEAASPPILSYPGGRVEHGKDMIVVSLASGRATGPLKRLGANEAATPGSVAPQPPGARTSGTPGAP